MTMMEAVMPLSSTSLGYPHSHCNITSDQQTRQLLLEGREKYSTTNASQLYCGNWSCLYRPHKVLNIYNTKWWLSPCKLAYCHLLMTTLLLLQTNIVQ